VKLNQLEDFKTKK